MKTKFGEILVVILKTLKMLIFVTILQLMACGGGSSPSKVINPPPTTPPPAPEVNINWQVLSINGGLISSVVALSDEIILAARDNNLFRSTDGGVSWQALDAKGSNILHNNLGELITDSGYRSFDAGATWELLDIEMTPKFSLLDTQRLYSSQSEGTTKEIYASDDFGGSWFKYADFPTNVSSLWHLVADKNGNLTGSFLGGSFGNQNWSFDATLGEWSNIGIGGIAQSLFVDDDERVFISTSDGLFRQDTFQSNWTELSTITEPGGHEKVPTILGEDPQGIIWASWGNRLYHVGDEGLSSEVVSINLGYQFNGRLGLSGENIFLASNNGIWKFNSTLLPIISSNFSQIGLPEVDVNNLFMVSGELYVSINAGAGASYLAKYSESVADWEHQYFYSERVEDLKINDNGERIVATSYAHDFGYGWLYRIEGNGNLTSLLPFSSTPIVKAVDISEEGAYTIATGYDSEGDWDDKLLQSLDSGESWQDITNNLVEYTPVNDVVSTSSGILIAATEKGIYFRPANNENWAIKGAENKEIKKLSKTASGDLIAAGNGIYLSKDNGNSWQDISYNLPQLNITDFDINSQGTIWVATHQGVFMLPKEENKWRDGNSQLTNTELTSLVIDETDQIIIGQKRGFVLRGSIISQ